MDLQLADRIAIITGSSKGLGFASARALVAEGCRVTICARGEAALSAAAAELRTLVQGDSRVLAVAADVSTPEIGRASCRERVEGGGFAVGAEQTEARGS